MEPTEEQLPDPQQPSIMDFYKSSRKRKGEGSQAATSGHSQAKKIRKSETRSELKEEDSSGVESDDEKAASDKVATVKQVLARSTGLKQKKDDSSSGESSSKEEESCNVQNPQEARHLSIQRCIQSLVHANQCKDANCCLPSCQKMKRVIQHTRGCKKKFNGECPICKQFITLCCLHAKQCQEQACTVPFCINIKHKLRQQQLQQRLQQVQLLRRRIAAMTRQAPAQTVVKQAEE